MSCLHSTSASSICAAHWRRSVLRLAFANPEGTTLSTPKVPSCLLTLMEEVARHTRLFSDLPSHPGHHPLQRTALGCPLADIELASIGSSLCPTNLKTVSGMNDLLHLRAFSHMANLSGGPQALSDSQSMFLKSVCISSAKIHQSNLIYKGNIQPYSRSSPDINNQPSRRWIGCLQALRYMIYLYCESVRRSTTLQLPDEVSFLLCHGCKMS